MIDWIKLKGFIPDFKSWKDRVGISFGICLDPDSGEIVSIPGQRKKGVYTAKWYHYELEIYPLLNSIGVSLVVKGSLHKSYQNGSNWQSFTFMDLQDEIKSICGGLCFAPESLQILNMELGINIPFPCSPIDFLEANLLMAGNHVVARMDGRTSNDWIGYFSKWTEYDLKLYDKGYQNSLNFNLFRFEIKSKKMRTFDGIKSLADLQNKELVYSLMPCLQNAWDKVLLFEIPDWEEIDSHSNRQYLQEARHRSYWETLRTSPKFRDEKKKLKKLSAVHGNGIHRQIKTEIQTVWEGLF